jgi:hypothetical protein
MPHKLDVLRQHCAAEGRPYEEIEKTCMFSFDVGENGEKVGPMIEQLRRLAGIGIQTAIGSVKDVSRITPLEIIGREVVPVVAGF